jgi:hypothetical protein
MIRMRPVRKSQEGCFGLCALRCNARSRPSGSPSRLWGTGGFDEQSANLQSAREESGRSPGQGCRRLALKGRTPREAPAVVGLKTRRSQGTSGRCGPRNRGLRGRSGTLCRCHTKANGMWVPSRWKHRRSLSEGETSEGTIPRALPVRNKTGTGSEGESRQEGSQTLKTERSGQAKPATSGPRIPQVL